MRIGIASGCGCLQADRVAVFCSSLSRHVSPPKTNDTLLLVAEFKGGSESKWIWKAQCSLWRQGANGDGKGPFMWQQASIASFHALWQVPQSLYIAGERCASANQCSRSIVIGGTLIFHRGLMYDILFARLGLCSWTESRAKDSAGSDCYVSTDESNKRRQRRNTALGMRPVVCCEVDYEANVI